MRVRTKQYDPYWRCEVVRCPHCGMLRPLGYFAKCRGKKYGISSHCKRCIALQGRERRRKYMVKSRETARIRYYGTDGGATARARERANYIKRHDRIIARRAELYAKNHKRIRTYHVQYIKRPSARFVLLARYIRDEYGSSLTKEHLRERFLGDRTYQIAWSAWRISGYCNALAVCLKLRDGGDCNNVNDYVIITGYEKRRSTRLSIGAGNGTSRQCLRRHEEVRELHERMYARAAVRQSLAVYSRMSKGGR